MAAYDVHRRAGRSLSRMACGPKLVPNDGSQKLLDCDQPIHHFVGDLVPAVSRQAMQHNGVRVSQPIVARPTAIR
jgi:hypothetical protein